MSLAREEPGKDPMTNGWGFRLINAPPTFGVHKSSFTKLLADEIEDFGLVSLTASGSVANEMAIMEATNGQPERCLFAMGSYVVGTGSMLEYSSTNNIGQNSIGVVLLPGDEKTSAKARKQTIPFPYHVPCVGIDNRDIHKLERACLEHLEHRLLYAKLFSNTPFKAVMMEHVLSGGGGILSPRFLQQLGIVLKKHGVVVIVDEIMSGGRVGPKFSVTSTTPKSFRDGVNYITFGKFMKCGMLMGRKTAIREQWFVRGNTTEIDHREAYSYVITVLQKIGQGAIKKRKAEVIAKLTERKKDLTEENVWGEGLQLYTSWHRPTNDDNTKHRLLPMLEVGNKILTKKMTNTAWTRTKMCQQYLDAAEAWLAYWNNSHMDDLKFIICKYIMDKRLKDNLIFPGSVQDFVSETRNAEAVVEHFRKRKREEGQGSCTLNLKNCITRALMEGANRQEPLLKMTRKKCKRIGCFEYNARNF